MRFCGRGGRDEEVVVEFGGGEDEEDEEDCGKKGGEGEVAVALVRIARRGAIRVLPLLRVIRLAGPRRALEGAIVKAACVLLLELAGNPEESVENIASGHYRDLQ